MKFINFCRNKSCNFKVTILEGIQIKNNSKIHFLTMKEFKYHILLSFNRLYIHLIAKITKFILNIKILNGKLSFF